MMPSMHGVDPPDNRLVLVYTTLPDAPAAETLGAMLISERLAACVNIYPGMISLYEWNGTTERAGEAGMIIKTTPSCLDLMLSRARALHPYQVPALLVLGYAQANGDYAAWARARVTAG